MKKHLAIVAAAFAMTACGGGGDAEEKNLFSLWTSEQNGTPLELTGANFGTGLINLYTTDGTRCICDLAIVGTQASGSIALTGCISIPYDAKRNPTCEAINGAGSYTKTADVLSITKNGVTGTFR